MRRDPPSRTSLLVRNIPRAVTGEDLRYHAEKYGPVRDVYLPKDYYTGEPRGMGFIEFTNGRDADDAKYGMDGMSFNGRQISVVFALQGRKRPDDYRRARAPERSNYRGYGGGGGGGGRRRSYSRSPRRSSSRSPRRRSASRSPRRSTSRSRSPVRRPYRRSASRSPDDYRRGGPARSPPPRGSRSPPRSRGRSEDEDDYDRRD